jgi:hypothetical protein
MVMIKDYVPVRVTCAYCGETVQDCKVTHEQHLYRDSDLDGWQSGTGCRQSNVASLPAAGRDDGH